MSNQGERLARVEEKLDNLILEVREMKNGFAAKWVQTVVAGLVAAILLGFIGVVVAFFIPRHNQPIATNPQQTTERSSGSTSPATSQQSPGSSPSNLPEKSNGNGGVQVTLPKVSQP